MTSSGPLAGLRVVEIASMAPAPFGCMLLADLGAEVIRIDRTRAAALSGPPGPMDRGRRSIAVDLKTPEGVEVVRRLVENADVFVEGFRPGVAERLGIGPEDMLAVNPKLIYGRMTGWGQDGPLAQRAGHDINYIAVSGALGPLGRPGERPHAPLNTLGDFAGGGSFLALGVLAALFERERSGKGQVIDAAMVDGSSVLMAFLHGMKNAGMWEGKRGTNLLDGAAAFYDTYETADGKFMAVGSIEPHFYSEMLGLLSLDPADLPSQMDPANWEQIRSALAAAFASKARDEWTEIFFDSDACVSPVLSPWEAHEHPHSVARQSFVDVGGSMQPAPAPRFSRTPPAIPTPMDDDGRDLKRTLLVWGVASDEATRWVSTGIVI